tara:strand:+ start:3767 stop:5566 length:1800 start_codon:yes stop_codon:yes gene_type:complete
MAEELFNIEPPPHGTFATKDAQAAPIYVNNATILGYSQEIQYFGGDIGFKKTVSLDIQCVVTDITNQSGAAVASKNLMEFLNDSQDYSEVILNGRQMGPAKVVGFSVNSADMVNSASCAVSFLIHETYADLSALSSNTYYADYAGSLPISDFGQILDSFSDSISLSRGDNQTSYSRNISIAANKSLNIQKLGDVIKEFVRGVLAFGTFSFPDLSGTEEDIKKLADPANNFKKFITETINDTSNTYTFQESLSAGNVEGDYSLVVTDNYTRDQNGIETVRENGSIIGLTSPRINAAEVGYAAELVNADARMKAFYLARRFSPTCPDLNTDDSGNLIFFTKGKTTNTFEGTITYSLTSNNDPSYKDGNGEKWDYTITLDSDGVYETATEQGTINGSGYVKYDGTKTGLERYTKYQTAKTFLIAEVFKNNNVDINNRVSLLIDASIFDVSPKTTRRTESHAPRQGVITYSRSFSNKPIYQKNGTSDLIKKLTASSTLTATLPITHEFVALAPNTERKIVQEQSTESLSTASSTITATAYRINPADEKNQLSRIGNISKEEINFVTEMDGDTDYMGSAGFSFSSLNEVIFTLNTSYNGGIGSC